MFHQDSLIGMVLLTTATVVWGAALGHAAEITVQKSKAGAVVKIDGQLFTEYITGFSTPTNPATPILWPILGPTGKRMSREYPMAEGPKFERQDHPHHRSLWFNHGDVNGLSFWDKDAIIHREFVKLESGPTGVIVTRNDWVDKEGKALSSDVRSLTFGVDGLARWIDFDVTVTAANGPVTFGDTKEGSFGIRLWETMKVDAKKNNPDWGGHIINSEGDHDGDAWAKRASWVDYYGPVEGETLGVAILNHPSSFRFPTYWHVRTYGLFAANPFGVHDFEKSESANGAYTILAGESIALRYRVLFHKGDEKEAKIAEAYAKYAKEKK